MEPNAEHTFYMWIIIVGIISAVAFVGMLIDRYFINRALKMQMRKNPVRAINGVIQDK